MASFESLVFLRGMSARYQPDRPFIKEVRSDRRPRDSSFAFHAAADDWFYRRFGVRYRTHAVFVTSRTLTATAYAASPAHVMRVVPLTHYRYCWSPKVSDLLFKANEFAAADTAAINNFLDSADYQERGLEEAHAAGHEVMVHCDRFVAIPMGLFPLVEVPAASGIVLPLGF